MRKSLLVILSVLIFGVSPVLVYAEDNTTANTTADTATTETNTGALTADPPHAMMEPSRPVLYKGVRPTIHQELKDGKEMMHAEMSQARTAFKENVQAIKDQTKQTIVSNLDTRLENANKHRTTEMSTRLDRLTTILGKISSKAATLKSQGKNTATLDSDITSAQTAIDAAKQAVIDQAAKDYVMAITTDTALRGAASTVIKQFMADIKAVFTKVVASQTAVHKAYSDAATLMGVTPTSAEPTPTTP